MVRPWGEGSSRCAEHPSSCSKLARTNGGFVGGECRVGEWLVGECRAGERRVGESTRRLGLLARSMEMGGSAPRARADSGAPAISAASSLIHKAQAGTARSPKVAKRERSKIQIHTWTEN